MGGDRKVEGARPFDPAGRAEHAFGAQARRLRARAEQGPSGLFRPPGRTSGERRNQIQIPGHLTAFISSRDSNVRIRDHFH